MEASGRIHGPRHQQPALQRLRKKAELRIKAAPAAHHHGGRLFRPALQAALLEQLRVMNQAGAAVQAQGAAADQAGIGPSQGLLQCLTIAAATNLGSTTGGRCQAAVQADRQHQA